MAGFDDAQMARFEELSTKADRDGLTDAEMAELEQLKSLSEPEAAPAAPERRTDQFDRLMPGGFGTDFVAPTGTYYSRAFVSRPPEEPVDLEGFPKLKDAVKRDGQKSWLMNALGAIGDYSAQVKAELAARSELERSVEEARRSWAPPQERGTFGSMLETATGVVKSTQSAMAIPLDAMATWNDAKPQWQLDNPEAAAIRAEGAFAIASQRNKEAQRALAVSEISHLEMLEAANGRVNPELAAQREALEGQLPLDLREEGAAAFLSEITAGSASTLQAAAEGATTGGALALGGGAVAYGLTRSPTVARKVMKTALKVGGMTGAATYTYRQESGAAFKESADWVGSDGKPLSLEARAGAAIITGLVNTGIEIAELSVVMKALGPATATLTADAEAAIKAKEFKAAVARDPRMRAMLVRVAKAWVGASAPEVVEEGAQQLAGQAVHAAFSQDLSVFSPKEVVEAMGQSVVPMFFGAGLIGPATHVAAELSLRGEHKRAGERVVPLLKLAVDADMQAKPEEFVELAKGVGAGPVYVRGDAVKRFYQERTGDEADRQKQLEEALGPGAVDKVEQAAATGGSVEIPLEALPKWASTEAAAALVDDSSTHSEAPTPRELRATAFIEEAAQKLAAEEISSTADSKAFADTVDRWAEEQVTAGQPKARARTAALIIKHMVMTAAKDAKKSPLEIADRAEFQFLKGDEQPMRAEDVSRGAMSVKAPDIEYFLTDRLQSQDVTTPEGRAARNEDFYRDSTTGVRNARFWALEEQTATTVGRISIEGVKKQNDTYGHQAGDSVYAAAAQAMVEAGLDNGTLSKDGGDFAIANVTQEQLDKFLAIANKNPLLQGYELLGHVALLHEDEGEGLTRAASKKHNAAKEALEAADQRAKRGQEPKRSTSSAKFTAKPVTGTQFHETAQRTLESLTPEEQFQAMYTEPETGLLTKDARDRYLEAHPKKHHVSIDLNLLKAYNKLVGEKGGDQLIAAFGKLIAETGGREFLATHVSGDEYTLDTDDIDGVTAFLTVLRKEAEEELIDVTFTDGHSGIVPGVSFGVGIGPTIDLAEGQLNADKERLAAAGKRGKDFDAGLAIARQNLARGAEIQARRSGVGEAGAPAGSAAADVVPGVQATGVAGAGAAVAQDDVRADTGVGSGSEQAGRSGALEARIAGWRQELAERGPKHLEHFDKVIAEREARRPLRTDEAELVFAGFNSADNVALARKLVAAREDGDWKTAATARLDYIENLSPSMIHLASGESVSVPDSVWTQVDAWMRDAQRDLYEPEEGLTEMRWRNENPSRTPPFPSGPRIGGMSRWNDKGMQVRADAQREEFDRHLHGSAQSDRRRYQANALRTGEEQFPPDAQERIDEATKKTYQIARALEEHSREKLRELGFEDGTITDSSPRAMDVLSTWIADEVAFEADPDRGANSGIGWYSAKFQEALDTLVPVFPQLAKPGPRAVFTAVIAITSDGQKVKNNFKLAVKLFRQYLATGKLGAASSNRDMSANIRTLNDLIEKFGADGLTEQLLVEARVDEHKEAFADTKKKFNLKSEFKPDYEPQVELPLSAVLLGPKLGAFFANLSGATGYLTMDRWWSRTFNRMRGTLLDKATPQGLSRLRALLGEDGLDDEAVIWKALELQADYEDRNWKPDFAEGEDLKKLKFNQARIEALYENETDLDKRVADDRHYGLAVNIWQKIGPDARAKYDPEGRYDKTPPPAFVKARADEANARGKGGTNALSRAKKAIGADYLSKRGGLDPEEVARERGYDSARDMFDRFELERAANTIVKAEFLELQDAPSNRADRTFMIDTAKMAQKKLGERGIDISIADIQAALWYYEKRLYAGFGAKDSASESYLDAAKEYAQKQSRRRGARPGGSTARGDGSADTGAANALRRGAEENRGGAQGSRGRLAQVATEEDRAATPNEKIRARVEEIVREYLMVEGFTRPETKIMDPPSIKRGDSVAIDGTWRRVLESEGTGDSWRLVTEGKTFDIDFDVPVMRPSWSGERVVAESVRFPNDPVTLSAARREPVVEVYSWGEADISKRSRQNETVETLPVADVVAEIGSPELTRDLALYVQAKENQREYQQRLDDQGDIVDPEQVRVGDLVRPVADQGDIAGEWSKVVKIDVEEYATDYTDVEPQRYNFTLEDGAVIGSDRIEGEWDPISILPPDQKPAEERQVQLTPRWYQPVAGEAEVPKGYFDGAEQKATGQVLRVFLNKTADVSTVLHEAAHGWLEFYRDLASQDDATDEVRRKWSDIAAWLGVKDGEKLNGDQHELFARTFEAYLLRGKAPKKELESAFNSLKRWLLGIYRSVRGVPGARLDPKAIAVFDAMLATQDEAEAYQRAQGLAPADMKPATVTDEKWQAQIEAQRNAVSEGSRKAELRAIRDALRVHERWWKDGVKKLKAVFSEEYEALPGVRAQRLLRETKTELDPFDLPDNTGQIAEAFGFADVDSLIKALAEVPEKSQWVEEHAQEEMRQQHPGILERRDWMRAAIADGLNAYTEKRLLDERANLRKRDPRIGAAPVAVLRRAAAIIVERTRLGKLNAGAALQREAKAAKESYEAAARGEWNNAAEANQRQMLNHFLYKEIMGAREIRTQLEELGSKLSKKSARERLGKASTFYRDSVDFILTQLGLAEPVDEAVGAEVLQQVSGQLQGDAINVGDPDWLPGVLEAIRGGGYKRATVAQAWAVVDALTQIQAAARQRTEAVIEGRKLEESEIVARLINEAKENKKQNPNLPSSPSAASLAQKAEAIPGIVSAPLLKIETMVDWLGGALVGKDVLDSMWYQAVFKPLKGAWQREADLFKQRIAPIIKAMEAIPDSVRKTWMDPIDGAKLFPTHRVGNGEQLLSAPSKRFELLVMALNAGTPSSLERLTKGRNITVDEVRNALGALTREEIDWANAVGEAFDGMWPEISAMEERVTGLKPKALERRAMVLENGVLEGHYFPAIYDRRVSVVGERQANENEVAALMDKSFHGFGTQHGHTKARVEGFVGPIQLEPHAIITHLAQAVHDLAFREPLMQVGRRILHPDVDAILKTSLGVKRAQQFRQWASDVGTATGVEGAINAGWLLQLARKARANTTISALGYSVPNFFEDLSAIPSAFMDRELESPSIVAGLATFFKNPLQAVREVEELSPTMRAANDTLQRDLTQQIAGLTKQGLFNKGPFKWLKSNAFVLIEASFKATATPLWIAMYQQSVRKGDNHARAVDRADKMVGRLFPMHSAVNAAGLLRDKGWAGMSVQFYGFFSTAINVQFTNVQEFYESKSAEQRAKAAGRALGYFIAISIVGAILRGRGPDKDEDASTWALRTMLTSGLSHIPLLGDLGSAIDARIRGEPVRARPSSALAGIIMATFEAVDGVATKEPGKAAELAVRAAGPLLGLPASQALRTGKYVADVASGERTPADPGDFASGLIYGETDRGQLTPFNAPGRILSGPEVR
jgi:GGDEF domain-containing protein